MHKISEISEEQRLTQAFGRKLKLLRLSRSLSQQEAADGLNMSPSAYSKLENGKTNVTLIRVSQIARYFEVYCPDFLDEEMTLPRSLSEMNEQSDVRQLREERDIYRRLLSRTLEQDLISVSVSGKDPQSGR